MGVDRGLDAHLAGGFRRGATRVVRHARLLTSVYPATLEAVRDGHTSREQAAVVVDAVETLPGNPGLRAAGFGGRGGCAATVSRPGDSDAHPDRR